MLVIAWSLAGRDRAERSIKGKGSLVARLDLEKKASSARAPQARDRLGEERPRQALAAMGRQNTYNRHTRARNLRPGHAPVSYTHLTLPTILLV